MFFMNYHYVQRVSIEYSCKWKKKIMVCIDMASYITLFRTANFGPIGTLYYISEKKALTFDLFWKKSFQNTITNVGRF